jgi:AcrR family transcriptional regulator
MADEGEPVEQIPGSGDAIDALPRARIVRAVADVVAERGVAGTSIELAITRAQVSRRTFHKHFDGLQQALIAVLDEGYQRAATLVERAFASGGSWSESMRSALAATLAFFDSEPALARVCLVEAAAGDPLVREHLERRVRAFRVIVVERLHEDVASASPLAPEGALASVMGVVRARLIAPESGPLIELLGPLMGLIVGPFVPDAQVGREVEAGDALARELLARRALPEALGSPPGALARAEIPLPLAHPSAFRLRECLRYVAAHPGASNSQVAAGVGIAHRGQTALLLRRLVSLGLLVKYAGVPGHANAWRVTAVGERAAGALDRAGHLASDL